MCLIDENDNYVFDETILKGMVLDFFSKLYTDDGCVSMGSTLHDFPLYH